MSKSSWNVNASTFVPRSKAAAPAAAAAPAVAPAPTPDPTPAPAPVASTPKAEDPAVNQVAQTLTKTNIEDSGAADSWETHSVSEDVKQEKSAETKTETTKQDTKTVVTGDKTSADPEAPQVPQQEEIDSDPREHLNIIFIGHVDAGKSTLSGNLLYLTGKVDKRLIEKYEREAKEKNRGTWFIAYIMDTNDEERSKGITIEVGRAHFETQNKRYTILDAPGHKNYVPNMIGGAAQADVGILVISARQGEFEAGFERGGQTREHAMLAKTLGIRPLIVVINKMDDRGWAKERYDEIVGKLNPFLRKECQYAPKDIIFLPISGYSGANLFEPIPKEDCSWYDGPSLIQILDAIKPPDRNEKAPVRIPVTDRFKEMGTLNVHGKVESGTCFKGQKLVLMPNNVQSKVTSLLVDEKLMKRAGPGENVQISFSNLEESDVSVGFVLCEAERDLVHVVTEFIAQLVIVEMPPGNPLFMNGYESVMHIHTAVRECTVEELLSEIDRKTKKPSKKKPAFVKTGAIVTAKLTLATPVCLEIFETYPQLGRFTLRDKGRTIAVGKVIKV